MIRTLLASFVALAALLPVAMPIHAEATNPNRNLPLNIDADKVTVDDRNKIHVFEGNVVMVQGTMTLKGDKVVVTQDAAGFYTGVATAETGRLVYFRQKRVKDDTWIDGEAERIEYNSQNERAKLFNRAKVQNAGDLVQGQYIEYDVATENYLVTNIPGQTSPAGKSVHVVIQPKQNKNNPANAGPR